MICFLPVSVPFMMSMIFCWRTLMPVLGVCVSPEPFPEASAAGAASYTVTGAAKTIGVVSRALGASGRGWGVGTTGASTGASAGVSTGVSASVSVAGAAAPSLVAGSSSTLEATPASVAAGTASAALSLVAGSSSTLEATPASVAAGAASAALSLVAGSSSPLEATPSVSAIAEPAPSGREPFGVASSVASSSPNASLSEGGVTASP